MPGLLPLATLLLAAPARAAGLHAGIPLDAVPGLATVQFQDSAEGWTAQVPGGLVRVYVAPDEALARAWVERMKAVGRVKGPYAGPLPAPEVDEAWGDGDDTLVVRDGNLGVMVQARTGAAGWVAKLLAAAEREPRPWPAPPRLVPRGDGTWTVEAPAGAAQLAWEGGRRLPGPALVFSEPPRALVAWDRLGRAARVELEEGGEPAGPRKGRP